MGGRGGKEGTPSTPTCPLGLLGTCTHTHTHDTCLHGPTRPLPISGVIGSPLGPHPDLPRFHEDRAWGSCRACTFPKITQAALPKSCSWAKWRRGQAPQGHNVQSLPRSCPAVHGLPGLDNPHTAASPAATGALVPGFMSHLPTSPSVASPWPQGEAQRPHWAPDVPDLAQSPTPRLCLILQPPQATPKVTGGAVISGLLLAPEHFPRPITCHTHLGSFQD